MSRRLNIVLFLLLLLLAASFHHRLSLGPEKDFGTDNGQAATGLLLAVRGRCRCCSLGVRAVRVVLHSGVAATVFSCCVCRRYAEVHRRVVAGGVVRRSSGGGADSGSRGVVVVVVSFAVVVVGVDNVAGTEVFPLVPANVVR